MTIAVEEQAALDFVLTLRRRWADTVYPHLRETFDAVNPERGRSPAEIAPTVHALPGFGWFAWLERGSQKMLWRAVGDAVGPRHPRPAPQNSSARVLLDPSLQPPEW
jgi:hypothetical protein